MSAVIERDDWITNRLPTAKDADCSDMVRWGKSLPGMLCRWTEVRRGEAWKHSAAWKEENDTN